MLHCFIIPLLGTYCSLAMGQWGNVTMEYMPLSQLLNPTSIAVIGASSNKKKLGWQVLNNIISGGYSGKVYPVNIKEDKIEGKKAYQSVQDIKEEVDLAIVVIPAPAVPSVVEECGEKGISNVIIISAGFSEKGSAGKKREETIKNLADRYGINILGPNCLGLINKNSDLNATFAHADMVGSSGAGHNKLAFISQSGAIGSSVLDWTGGKGFDLSYFVSLGNKAGVDENELLNYFYNDKNTDVVALYLEEITDGKRFMEAVSRLTARKPVIILKAGMTKAGNRASLSHTGSMGGSQQATTAGLERSGAIVASSLQEFRELLVIWGKKKEVESGDVYIVSNAGGPLVVTSDQLEKYGLSVGKLSSATKQELTEKLPEAATKENPLDIIGDADAARYQASLEAVLKDERVQNVLVLLTPQTSTQIEETAKVVATLSNKYKKKLVLSSFIGGGSMKEAKRIIENSSAIHFDHPVQAVRMLHKLKDFRRKQKEIKPYKGPSLVKGEKKGEQKDYVESMELLKKEGVPTVKTVPVHQKKDLEGLSYPIVLKAVGPSIVHKTDEELLAPGIKDKKSAWNIWKRFSKKMGEEDHCVAQPMVKKGKEMLLGFERDSKFGPLIMLGMGGIYTEIFRDVSLEVDDVTKTRAKKMIQQLRSYPLLQGSRGEEGVDISALADTVVKVARLSKKHPEIFELDINPLFAGPGGVQAADVRIIE